MGRQANGEDLEPVEHFPAYEEDRNYDGQDGHDLSERHAITIGIKAFCNQAENVQRGEAKNQGPENVVHVALFGRLAQETESREKDEGGEWEHGFEEA